MLDQLFSPQWIFDRCTEASRIYPLILAILIVGMSCAVHILGVYRKSHAKAWLTTTYILFFILPLIVFGSRMFSLFLDPDITSFILPLVGFLATSAAYFWFLWRKRWHPKSLKGKVLQIIITSPLFFIQAFIITFVTAFIIIDCNSWMMWRGVTSAHQLHAHIKWGKMINDSYPTSESQLKSLDEETYQRIINQGAKSKYIYNSDTNKFYWFVRPNQHHIAIFTSEHDFSYYCLNDMYCFNNIPKYPPSFPGPWDQLP